MAAFHMATCKLKEGQLDSAIEEFKRCEAVRPSPEIYDGLGCCYHADQKYDLAIDNFNKAIAGEPRNVQFYKNRAQCFFENLRYESCIADLQHALEINQADA